jgi:hypothetical protein
MPVNPDGSVLASRRLRLSKVTFRLVELPFEWTYLRLTLTIVISMFANEMGLSASAIGRDLNTSFPEFPNLAKIEIPELDPVVRYVHQRWSDVSSDLPPPSRETIAATLAGLGIRNRARGRNTHRK